MSTIYDRAVRALQPVFGETDQAGHPLSYWHDGPCGQEGCTGCPQPCEHRTCAAVRMIAAADLLNYGETAGGPRWAGVGEGAASDTRPPVHHDAMAVYADFWAPLVETDGVIDREKVARELADFSFVMNEYPAVLGELTGGQMSKCMYYARDIIALVNARQAEAELDYATSDAHLRLQEAADVLGAGRLATALRELAAQLEVGNDADRCARIRRALAGGS